MTIGIRLDPATQALIQRLIRSRGQSKPAVIRAAVHALAEAEEPPPGRQRPYERMRHLIGVADSGGLQISEGGGRKFRELLARRAHERRPR